MKGLSRGRRVHRGHRDMPPARPPVVTEAPLSPRRALRRGEDPPPPPRQRPGRSASPTFYLRSTSVRGQPWCLGRPRRPPDGAVAAESQGRRRPQGARSETLRGAVWRWSHANPVWSRRRQTRGVFRGRRASSSSPPFPRGPAGGVSGRLRSPRHLNP